MKETEATDPYLTLLQDISSQILQSRYRAARLVNRELLLLYFTVGKRLSEKVAAEKWGAKVLEQLSADLQNQLPGLRGFSYRNLRNMRQFAEAYSQLIADPSYSQVPIEDNQSESIWQIPSAKLSDQDFKVFVGLGFSHHILLLNRCHDLEERLFYMRKAVANQWTHEMLDWQIKARLYQKQGQLPNNFEQTLSEPLKVTALQAFKDEYLLDFINVEKDDERVVEKGIVQNIREFILKMGTGFSFVGNQYRLVIDEQEFFVDLLFFNRQLQCLVAVELKRSEFKPEYLGQLSFYVNVLNDLVRLPHENPSIGILLCKEKSNAIVEYAFQGYNTPMGVATYQLSSDLPEHLRDVLPDPEALKKLLD
ncbi:PDDEXK nuclease domain-containing protein [Spirosoma radiotolerans]|uniref:PDDEXK nuclease domain-containing protein n=1 Tax=Spirosoma radiotolerans TaxID=1379870 RepID=UPI0006272F75|nr:PDDEXK nuclease domain-containing protein [Spirosoma radiotolerans]